MDKIKIIIKYYILWKRKYNIFPISYSNHVISYLMTYVENLFLLCCRYCFFWIFSQKRFFVSQFRYNIEARQSKIWKLTNTNSESSQKSIWIKKRSEKNLEIIWKLKFNGIKFMKCCNWYEKRINTTQIFPATGWRVNF